MLESHVLRNTKSMHLNKDLDRIRNRFEMSFYHSQTSACLELHRLNFALPLPRIARETPSFGLTGLFDFHPGRL